MQVIREQIIENLRRHDIGDEFSFLPALPKASVLIPLTVKNGQLFTLMTLRSQEVRRGVCVCFNVDTVFVLFMQQQGLRSKIQVLLNNFERKHFTHLYSKQKLLHAAS